MSLNTQQIVELIGTANKRTLEEVPSSDLVQVYNYLTGRQTKKFSGREQGISQVLSAIDAHGDEPLGAPEMNEVAEKGDLDPQPPITAAEKSERPFRIKLPFTGKTRAPKKNSKRADLLARMTDGYGILIEELTTETRFGWPRKDAYEGIRHIHVSLGYGLDQYPDGRVYAHTDEAGKHFPHTQGEKPSFPVNDEGA